MALHSLLLSAVVSAIVSIVVVEYRLRRQQSIQNSSEVEKWYIEAIGLVQEAERALMRIAITKNIEQTWVIGKINPISLKLAAHAEQSPEGVDEESVAKMRNLRGGLESLITNSRSFVNSDSPEEYLELFVESHNDLVDLKGLNMERGEEALDDSLINAKEELTDSQVQELYEMMLTGIIESDLYEHAQGLKSHLIRQR